MAKQDLLKGKHVLIVDDEEDVLDALSELLSDCVVEKAATFEDASAKLNRVKFDLAILDIMGVQGYDLLDIAIKNKITAVMLTAHAFTPNDTIKSFKKGAAYYLPKEEMAKIVDHLNDMLETQAKGKSTWAKWLDKFSAFYEKKFGAEWHGQEINDPMRLRELEPGKLKYMEKVHRYF